MKKTSKRDQKEREIVVYKYTTKCYSISYLTFKRSTSKFGSLVLFIMPTKPCFPAAHTQINNRHIEMLSVRYRQTLPDEFPA